MDGLQWISARQLRDDPCLPRPLLILWVHCPSINGNNMEGETNKQTSNMCTGDKGKQTNKQTSRGGTCRGVDAGGSCHAPSQLDPGELSHMCIHLMMDHDLTQLNALPCMGNAEHSPTWTSLGRQGQCIDSAHATFIHLTYNTL